MKTLSVGSYSSATLRPQDLLPMMLETLASLDDCPEYEQLSMLPFSYIPSYAMEDEGASWWETTECAEKVMELEEVLQGYTPDWTYWGAHPDDGADIGVWPIWDCIEDDIRDGSMLKINDLSEWPKDTEGRSVLLVSDHGNATMFDPDGNEIWAVV